MNLDMVCTCSIEGLNDAEFRRVRIFTRMGLTNTADLTTAIVLSLAFDFGCDAYLAADHWFGLSIDTELVPKGIYVECDHPADGLAAAWEVLADKFPERVSIARNGEWGVLQKIMKASYTNLSECKKLYTKKQAHYTTHGDDYESGCLECEINMSAHIASESALNKMWGTDNLNAAIEAAYG